MRARSYQKEYIDLGPEHYTEKEYTDCLKKLGRIGRFLGGDRASLRAFNALKMRPSSILDVGCGGGFFTEILAKKYPQGSVLGIDTSSAAIAFAKQKKYPNLRFEVPKTERLEEEEKFDVITATLVLHHLTDDEIIDFLKRSVKMAKMAVIINDLQRSWVAYLLYAMVAPIAFTNRLIFHDGLLSIRRSFKRKDWVRYMALAGISDYTITWEWAFRWIVTIKIH